MTGLERTTPPRAGVTASSTRDAARAVSSRGRRRQRISHMAPIVCRTMCTCALVASTSPEIASRAFAADRRRVDIDVLVLHQLALSGRDHQSARRRRRYVFVVLWVHPLAQKSVDAKFRLGVGQVLLLLLICEHFAGNLVRKVLLGFGYGSQAWGHGTLSRRSGVHVVGCSAPADRSTCASGGDSRVVLRHAS